MARFTLIAFLIKNKISLLFLIFICSLSFSQRVVGYYPQWVQGNLQPADIDYSVITHINHAFAWPDEEGNILHYDNMISQSITSDVHDNGAKILLSFGGGGQSWGFPVSAGVYLYSIEAGEFRQTKKMILLK